MMVKLLLTSFHLPIPTTAAITEVKKVITPKIISVEVKIEINSDIYFSQLKRFCKISNKPFTIENIVIL